jgi:hypothetical protein
MKRSVNMEASRGDDTRLDVGSFREFVPQMRKGARREAEGKSGEASPGR